MALKPIDAGLRIEIDGQLFSEYIVKNTPRPYMYPVIGAAGESVVRNFPMVKDLPEEKPWDHKHHRSLWFAHGSVNGMDFWTEDKDFGSQEHVAFGETKTEGNKASFTADTKWITHGGQCIMTDTRKITITALPEGEKFLDFDITLKASEGDVVLGDTKEGTMALRLCSSLSLKGEGAQGHAYNSADDKQKDIWGKHANWVCYYGPDPKGNAVGVVIYSHPSNLRSPTTWHARDYGLFAVNPFGLHDFEGLKKGDQDGKGNYTIKKGESLTLRYRFYFVKGKPKPNALEAKFKEYSAQ
ncbi:MAG: PmoA family protein [Verrucomicrobia bacterium]|nr:PmoA family protein [Verrucomicrobiota bacterium]